MSRTGAAAALTSSVGGRRVRSTSRPAVDGRMRTTSGHDDDRVRSGSAGVTALAAEDLVAGLAGNSAISSVELGFGHGLLCATLTELSEERIVRDVITVGWAAHLGVGDTPDANGSVCFAALADVVARLVGVADSIHGCFDAAWAIDPDAAALGYAPPSAPVAAVCLLPRDVRLRPCPRGDASPHLDAVHGAIWPVLDPLVRAWCLDGDLDLDTTNRRLGRPADASP